MFPSRLSGHRHRCSSGCFGIVVALTLAGCSRGGATTPKPPPLLDAATAAQVQANRAARSDRYPVLMENGRHGYIDHTGAVVITLPQGYEGGELFADDRAVVKTTAGYGYIDPTGTLVIGGNFAAATTFSEGLAAVQERGGSLYGFVDAGGATVIPPQFAAAAPFSEGVAAVCVRDPVSGKNRWGYIDRGGAFAIPPQFEIVESFADGRAMIADQAPGTSCDVAPLSRYHCHMQQGSVRFIDRTGREVTPRFLWASSFSEGVAVVWEGVSLQEKDEHKAGYIARDGAVVIAPRFTEAKPFSAGVAAVWEKTASGETRGRLVDHTGATTRDLYRSTMTRTGSNTLYLQDEGLKVESLFAEGVAVAKHYHDKTSDMVYMDTSGRIALSTACREAGVFSGGVAQCDVREGVGVVDSQTVRTYIDRAGNTIWRDRTAMRINRLM